MVNLVYSDFCGKWSAISILRLFLFVEVSLHVGSWQGREHGLLKAHAVLCGQVRVQALEVKALEVHLVVFIRCLGAASLVQNVEANEVLFAIFSNFLLEHAERSTGDIARICKEHDRPGAVSLALEFESGVESLCYPLIAGE